MLKMVDSEKFTEVKKMLNNFIQKLSSKS